jgi:hypothetical protein
MSNPFHTPCTRTGLPNSQDPPIPPTHSQIIHIVAHHADDLYTQYFGNPPNHWLLEYRLDLNPIWIGQYVVLHCRAEDCFNPDPSLGPVAEGWIDRIVDRTPHWLTFRIVDSEGEMSSLLSIPYVPLVQPIARY